MKKESTVIYQAKNGAIAFHEDVRHETIWATQKQLSEVFEVDQSVISRHIKTIFADQEVDKKSNMQKMHIANSDKPVSLYSLDIILSVGYKVNSAKAIHFRKWSNQVLKDHLVQGYSLNRSRLGENYTQFVNALSELQNVSSAQDLDTNTSLELIKQYAETWFSLDAYDREEFEIQEVSHKTILVTADELKSSLAELKQSLLEQELATEVFGQEREKDAIQGIIGNIYQTFGGVEVYPTPQRKAANLLYLIVKNHPFVDGNKRSGAFAFVWLLEKMQISRKSLSPAALTALTILVAKSQPQEKEKIIGLIEYLL